MVAPEWTWHIGRVTANRLLFTPRVTVEYLDLITQGLLDCVAAVANSVAVPRDVQTAISSLSGPEVRHVTGGMRS